MIGFEGIFGSDDVVMLTSVGPMIPTLRCILCGSSFCGIAKSMSPSIYVPGARELDVSSAFTATALAFTSSVIFHDHRSLKLDTIAYS